MKIKNFLIDLCLVGLLLFLINSFLNDYSVKKTLFDRDLVQFESDIKEEKVISSNYGATTDNSESTLSVVIKSISDFCINIIEIIVLIISNFISMLL